MGDSGVATDQRSVSDVVALGILVTLGVVGSVAIVGVGGMALGSITDQAEHDLADDSLRNVESRFSELADSSVDSTASFSFPEGAGGKLDANASGGRVIIRAETVDKYKPYTAQSVCSSNQTLGTIVHKNNNGNRMVYQGGGLWKQSPAGTQVESPPAFDYNGDSVDFSFISINGLNDISEGQRLTAKKSIEGSQASSANITNDLSSCWTMTGTEKTVPAELSVTIHSDLADGWAAYANNGMSQPLPDAAVNLDAGDNEVTMRFGSIGNASAVFTNKSDFSGNVVYTGLAQFAPLNADLNKSGSGFTAEQVTPHHSVAVYDSNEGSWAYTKDGERDWQYVNGGKVEKSELPLSTSGSPTVYTIGNDVPVCVAKANSINGMANSEKCAESMVGMDEENTLEDFGTAEFDVKIVDVDGPVTEGESLDVKIDIENVGTADGEKYVLLGDTNSELVDYATVSVAEGDTETITLTWDTTLGDAGSGDIIIEAGDSDSSDTESATVEEATTSVADFDVDISDGSTDSNVNEGETLDVVVDVENDGGDSEQWIVLRDWDGNPVAAKKVQLDSGESTTETIGWETGPDSAGSGELTVKGGDSFDTVSAQVNPAGTDTSQFDVRIDSVDDPVKTGTPLTVGATLENIGSEVDTQSIVLYDVDGNVVDVVDSGALGPSSSTSVTLTWSNPPSLDPTADNEIRVNSEDDSATEGVDVASQLLITDYEIGRTSGGINIKSVTVKNRGDQKLNQKIRLEGYDGSERDKAQAKTDAGQKLTLTGNGNNPLLNWSDTPDRTGNVTITTADDSVSERIVVKRDGPDCGEISYDGSGTSNDPYEIGTVDQLQCIEDKSLSADYELVGDIDATGTEYWNNGAGFDPIGDQQARTGGPSYGGVFDGNGYVIEGLHIERPNEYFVGLFAKTNYFEGSKDELGAGSTVKNVRLKDSHVHGKSVVGGLIGGAGGTVQNASVSGYIESEYQQVGGLVGHGHDADLNNRLVSRAEVVGTSPACTDSTHPWGATNVGIGGIVGGTGYETDVSTAYSLATVRGNSSTGGIVGWTSDIPSDSRQMYWANGTLDVSGEWRLDECGRNDLGRQGGGGIAGRMEIDDDTIRDSVYWNKDDHGAGIGEQKADADIIGRTTEKMQGLDVNRDSKLGNLTYDSEGGPWIAVPDKYPRFRWELEAAGSFIVEIDSIDKTVEAGETVTATATITNTNIEEETQNVVLTDFNGNPVDTEVVTIDGNVSETNTKQIQLSWETTISDNGTGTATVRTEDTEAGEEVTVTNGKESEAVTDFDVSVDGTNEPVTEGDRLTVEATVQNDGGADGEQSVVLGSPDGTVVDSKQVDLNSEQSTTVSLSWDTSTDDRGSGQISVKTRDDTATRTVTVQPGSVANFTVDSLASNDPVTVGETLTVMATVTNSGKRSGERIISLRKGDKNGQSVDIERKTIAAGKTKTVTLEWTPNVGAGGQTKLTAVTDGNSKQTTVEVEPPDGSTGQTTDPTTPPVDVEISKIAVES